MRNLANDTLAQVKGIWGRLDAGQRLVVSAVLAATLVGLGAIVWFAGQPSYETVYTVKSDDDIATVAQALERAGVTWKEGDSGRSFLVERSQKGKAARAIAEAGIAGADGVNIGGGLSLIEDSATKQWKLDLASRTAAANAIKQSLDGVQSASVTASVPRNKTAFRDRDAEQRPTATVVLRLRPGTSFESIAAVAASIASSQLMVPKANIEVASSTGNQRYRYDPDREAGGGGSSDFLALERRMAEDRARMAQDRLDQLWPGKTSVSVNIQLDPAWEVRSEKVLPTEPLVKSEKSKKDETTPGADKDGAKTGGGSSNVDKTREFVTEIGERRSGKMMQEIKRMTVALTYDKSLTENKDFKPADLENVVKAIVGWDPERDKPEAFSTLVTEFAPPPELDAVGGPGLADIALQWGPTVGQVIGVFVVVMFLRGLFKRSGKASPAAASAAPAVRAEIPLENLPPDEQQKILRREIERSIAGDPAALAKLLETWLVEQKA
jgi:flagellar biosynthesis/type III secretory pathway M-ring protein FliF/YscJ